MVLARNQAKSTAESASEPAHRHRSGLRITNRTGPMPAVVETSASVAEPHSPTNTPGTGATLVSPLILGDDAELEAEVEVELPQPATAVSSASPVAATPTLSCQLRTSPSYPPVKV